METAQERILANGFVDGLRDHRIDPAAHAELSAALRDLAAAWRDQALVEKAVAQDLVTTLLVGWAMVEGERDVNREWSARARELMIQIEGLILECLRSTT